MKRGGRWRKKGIRRERWKERDEERMKREEKKWKKRKNLSIKYLPLKINDAQTQSVSITSQRPQKFHKKSPLLHPSKNAKIKTHPAINQSKKKNRYQHSVVKNCVNIKTYRI